MENNDRQLLWIADNLDDLSTESQLMKALGKTSELSRELGAQEAKVESLEARVKELESQLAHYAPPNLYPMGFTGLPYSEQPTSNVPPKEQGQ